MSNRIKSIMQQCNNALKILCFPLLELQSVWPWHLTGVNKMPLQFCNYSHCKTVSSYCCFWWNINTVPFIWPPLPWWGCRRFSHWQKWMMVTLVTFTVLRDYSRNIHIRGKHPITSTHDLTHIVLECQRNADGDVIQTLSRVRNWHHFLNTDPDLNCCVKSECTCGWVPSDVSYCIFAYLWHKTSLAASIPCTFTKYRDYSLWFLYGDCMSNKLSIDWWKSQLTLTGLATSSSKFYLQSTFSVFNTWGGNRALPWISGMCRCSSYLYKWESTFSLTKKWARSWCRSRTESRITSTFFTHNGGFGWHPRGRDLVWLKILHFPLATCITLCIILQKTRFWLMPAVLQN